MISDRCDFNEFVLETKGKGYQEALLLFDHIREEVQPGLRPPRIQH